MKDIKQIIIFISCPGDIIDELNSIKSILEEFNKTFGKHTSINLKSTHWKTDTYTQVGTDVQEVINNQLEDEYDILVGLLWQKIGTSTKRDKSGTVEEINRAISNEEKEQLIYFKTTPPANLNLIDLDQLSKINEFKKELTSKGVLYKEFNSITSFENQFRIHLTDLIRDQFITPKKRSKEKILSKTNEKKYSSITKLISEVENKDKSDVELDLFDLTKKITSYFELITSTVKSINESLINLTTNIKKRTDDLNKFNNIKDHRLRMTKAVPVTNLLANDLDEFNNRINKDLPILSENFNAVGLAYPQLMLVASSYGSLSVEELRNTAIQFRDKAEKATEGCASLLQNIIKWPLVNPKFNNSKRETEVTLKNLTKEMLEGVILFNEAIKS